MDEHLPECDTAIWFKERIEDYLAPMWLDPPDDLPCQCDKLRACEQRVRREMDWR